MKNTTAIETLLSLINQPDSKTEIQNQDKVVLQAKREKNAVTLGFDPVINTRAQQAAMFRNRLEEAQAVYNSCAQELREYSAEKKETYNQTFQSDCTTFKIPYQVGANEFQFVQITFSNRYTLQQDTVIALRDSNSVPENEWDRLFSTKTTKYLKPEAVELLEKLLSEFGVNDVPAAMAALFDTTVEVAANKDYEKQLQSCSESTKKLVECVRRVSPSVKFPGSVHIVEMGE
jgi:hypothetical protein